MNIDRSKINNPIIEVSEQAKAQFNLILENDFTLKDKIIRISIDGKKCEGFTYSIGFSDANNDDFIVNVEGLLTKIYLDPFCAYYLSEGQVDYHFDPSTDEEGFIITNINQEKYHKKFWLSDKDSTPPLF